MDSTATTEGLTAAQVAVRALRAEASHEREIAQLTRLLNETETALAAADSTLANVTAIVDEHLRAVTPAPYTSERALIERLDATLRNRG